MQKREKKMKSKWSWHVLKILPSLAQTFLVSGFLYKSERTVLNVFDVLNNVFIYFSFRFKAVDKSQKSTRYEQSEEMLK